MGVLGKEKEGQYGWTECYEISLERLAETVLWAKVLWAVVQNQIVF